MKIFGRKLEWFNAIYIAIALATFKHSSWAFSSILEGPPPEVILDTSQPVLLGAQLAQKANWLVWGWFMASAVDVGMFFIGRAIRDYPSKGTRQPWGLWIAFLMAVGASGLTQIFHAIQHAAPIDVVATNLPSLQPDGFLYALMERTIWILPLTLPGMAFMYTISFKVQNEVAGVHEETVQEEKDAKRTEELTQQLKTFNLRQVSQALQTTPHRVKTAAQKLGVGNYDNRRWAFTRQDVIDLARHFGLNVSHLEE